MKKLNSFKPRPPQGFKPRVFNSQTRDWIAMYATWRWRKYRNDFIKFNPTCYSCGKKSDVCDHIKPHKGDWTLFEDVENHLPLCNLCHNYCTANFDKFDEPKTQDKIKWLVTKRKSNELVTKVYILNKEKYFPKLDR